APPHPPLRPARPVPYFVAPLPVVSRLLCEGQPAPREGASHMADIEQVNPSTTGTTSSTTGASGTTFGRAISAPMRAVSRIFTPPAAGPGSTPPSRNGAAIVDCGYYIAGERQAGDLDYAQAYAAACAREDAFIWLGLHEPGPGDLEDIAAVFDLDEFAVEDA